MNAQELLDFVRQQGGKDPGRALAEIERRLALDAAGLTPELEAEQAQKADEREHWRNEIRKRYAERRLEAVRELGRKREQREKSLDAEEKNQIQAIVARYTGLRASAEREFAAALSDLEAKLSKDLSAALASVDRT